MDVLKNTDHAAELIRQYFPLAARRLADGNIHDFARIAYFLEQPDKVIDELKKLEDTLQERFMAKFGKVFDKDPTKYLSKDQTKGLLTSYLNEWDSGFGFNSLSNQTAQPFSVDFLDQNISVRQTNGPPPRDFDSLKRVLPIGATPTITGFAAPPLFRLALLRLGYHWKDPGAGDLHGDITHRLQWFAITSAYQGLGITVNPLYLFQKLASPVTWNPEFSAGYSNGAAGRALWDFVCDCFAGLQPDPVGPTSSSASYRSPVNLQRDLTTNCEKSQDLPLLRRIITRKKLAMRDKVQALAGRKTVAIVEYTGADKTAVMDGQVAFYVKDKGK